MPPRWREVHVGVLAGEELASEEDFFPRQDGRIQWVRWSMKPWRTADGRIIGVLLFAEVITDQVTARRALTDSEQFRVTFENASIGIAHIASDGRLLRINGVACRMVGYSADELKTKSFLDATHLDDLAVSVAPFELMLDGKIDRYDAEKRYLRKDGSTVWAKVNVSCVRKSDRSIDYIIAEIEDISARKRAEEELRKSEEQFRSLILHYAPSGLIWQLTCPAANALEPWETSQGGQKKIDLTLGWAVKILSPAWKYGSIGSIDGQLHSPRLLPAGLGKREQLVGSLRVDSDRKGPLPSKAARTTVLRFYIARY